MVAAHNNDLESRAESRLKTAFVAAAADMARCRSAISRPTGDWDIVAADFSDIADRLGC